jgi:CheY-like chemotaxis protein
LRGRNFCTDPGWGGAGGSPSSKHNEVSVRARSDERGIVIEVKDSGSGISPEAREHIFEPFFTTKPTGGGTGLGLSICHGIVRSAGGEMSVESEAGRGTTFRVRLRVATPKRKENPEPAPRAGAAVRRGRILAVDDEELVLRTVQRILGDHDVVCCTGALDALKRLESGEHFDVILSDVHMPTMTGMDLYERLLERDPEEAAKIVFMSGGAITSKIDDFLATVPNARVDKPFSVEALLSAVEAVIERRPQTELLSAATRSAAARVESARRREPESRAP